MGKCFALALTLCAALAGCRVSEPAPPVPVSDALALLGKRYVTAAAQGRLVEGSPCEFMGGGVVWENEDEKLGWSDAVAVCGGVPVLLIARTRKSDAPLISLPLWKIVAVKVLPKVSNYTEEDLGEDPLELISPTAGQCDVGLPGSPPAYVLLRWGGRDAVAGPPAIQAVWQLDVKNDRFVALDPSNVRCEQLSMN